MTKTKLTKLETIAARVANDTCPKCGGELDTGWECNNCGFDASAMVVAAEERDEIRERGKFLDDVPTRKAVRDALRRERLRISTEARRLAAMIDERWGPRIASARILNEFADWLDARNDEDAS